MACTAKHGTMADEIPDCFGRELHLSASAFWRLYIDIEFPKSEAVGNVDTLQYKNHRLSFLEGNAGGIK